LTRCVLDLARVMDHTVLRPEATEQDIRRLVAEAVEHRFATVCVNGRWVKLATELLRDAGVEDAGKAQRPVVACAVVGFPLGANRSDVKALETAAAVKDGAREIDMVIALGAILAGDKEAARLDVAEVVRAARAHADGVLVKVILETAALTEAQTALGCWAAAEGGADFVKTSTGFHPKGGATAEAVRWLVKYGLDQHGLKVKASGGIRDLAAAEKMLAASAHRIGTSNGVAILAEAAKVKTVLGKG